MLDGVIQTRDELRDRAREAVAVELVGLRAAFDRLAQAYAQERDPTPRRSSARWPRRSRRTS
ncbi:hypothetical protein CKY47_33640 [Saccharothrix yanglingensis]|uniref:Uncharacterized protein n=1 Tax=Saccharothrix yanglingensis TaxID=659496 RepID=A0ABU0X9J2_9PSEU|nr:hypothetical protein [Saccharothrix yanglingensis]